MPSLDIIDNKLDVNVEDYYLIVVFFGVTVLISTVFQVCFFKLTHNDNKASTSKGYIFLSLLIGMFFSFATIYYGIYHYHPNYFSGVVGEGILEVAFEFIYFSFMICVTYSGDSIVAISILPKIIQMIQIAIFYKVR